MPQTCAAALVSEVNARPPVTATGLLEDPPVPPIPNSPTVLEPQQNAAPFAVSPQVTLVPTANEANAIPPGTATGRAVHGGVLSGTSANSQQYAAPVPVRPHSRDAAANL